MASKSDLKSCLMCEIERPCHGKDSQSPYFRFFDENWYIKISVKQNILINVLDGYIVYVKLALQNGEEETTIIKKDVSVSCHLVAGKEVLYGLRGFPVLRSQNEILTSRISLQDFENSSTRWKIFCSISCVEPAAIKIDNEKILLSTGSLLSDDPSRQTVAEIPADLQRLSDDFYSLLNNESIPDAKLTCCGRTWNVHRSILIARSEVLAAMFLNGMAESETGEICIKDIEAPVLNSLLKYVYSGKVLDLSGENVRGLYEAADKYALLGLKDACSVWMVKNISHENCLLFLAVADAHSDDWLRDAVVSFIPKHFDQIEIAIWINFCKAYWHLAKKVLKCYADSEED